MTSPVPHRSPYPNGQTDNLNILSIFYFIICGLYGLAGLIFFIYVCFGVLIGILGVASANRSDAGAFAAMGGVMACLGFFFIFLFGVVSFLYYKAGRGLRTRRSLTLIYVVAVLACLNFPLGTVLGIFTFVVLSKPGVKETFT